MWAGYNAQLFQPRPIGRFGAAEPVEALLYCHAAILNAPFSGAVQLRSSMASGRLMERRYYYRACRYLQQFDQSCQCK